MGSAAVSVVGMHGGETFGEAARQALANADVLIGSTRHMDAVVNASAQRVSLGPLGPALDHIERYADRGLPVCILASGDPGFFGIVRALATRLGSDRLLIYPAPSSVSLAAARLGMAWDDVVVVSAHGRPLADAVAEIVRCSNVAVLTSPTTPPEMLGRALLDVGARFACVAVCSQLGSEQEVVHRTDLKALASGTFDGLSVLMLSVGDQSGLATVRWGRPTSAFDHRAGMITKPEVRLAAIARLDLPVAGVLWDIGAGSGSIGIEAASLAPGLRVYAVEQNATDADRIRANALGLGVTVEVVVGDAVLVYESMPDPDRVFVGGGGVEVLDRALTRLRPGGVAVATYAAMDRALAAYERLGNLVQISVSNAVALPGAGGIRFVADNPVFLTWGTPR